MNNPALRLTLNKTPTGGGISEKGYRFRSSHSLCRFQRGGREAERRLVLLQESAQPADLQDFPLADTRSPSTPSFSPQP